MGEIVSKLRPHVFLDVGCGNGDWTVSVANRMGIVPENIQGIEINPRQASEAERKLRLFRVDLEAERWPFPEQSVSLITANQVLEHLKNAHFCLAECDRVLQVGGYLAIGIPNLAGLVNRLLLLFGSQPLCIHFPGPHVRSFTHRAFLSLLRLNPAFELVETRGSSLYPLPWPWLEVAAVKFPGLSAYTFYLLRKIEHRIPSAWTEMLPGGGATTYVT